MGKAGVFLDGSPKRDDTVVSFRIQRADGTIVNLKNCFSHWPLAAGDSCDTDHPELNFALLGVATTLGNGSINQSISTNMTIPNSNAASLTEASQTRLNNFLAPTAP